MHLLKEVVSWIVIGEVQGGHAFSQTRLIGGFQTHELRDGGSKYVEIE